MNVYDEKTHLVKYKTRLKDLFFLKYYEVLFVRCNFVLFVGENIIHYLGKFYSSSSIFK